MLELWWMLLKSVQQVLWVVSCSKFLPLPESSMREEPKLVCSSSEGCFWSVLHQKNLVENEYFELNKET